MTETENSQLQSYLEDIKDIKTLLSSNQQKPLVPAWSFYIWALMIFLGTVVHTILAITGSPLLLQALWLIWLPVLLVGSAFESAGFIQVFRKQRPVLLSPKVLNTYLSLFGLWTSFSAILVFLFSKGQLTPGLLLCILAACYMVIAQLSYHKLLIPGFALLAFGLILLILNWTSIATITITGLACAFSFLLGGWVSRSTTKNHG